MSGSTSKLLVGARNPQEITGHDRLLQQLTTSTATVVSGSTFTGNSGLSAYSVGDIVLALKQLWLIAT